MTFKAEVRDIGGCGVGTSVKKCATITAAVSFVTATSKQSWAGSWSITDSEGRVLLADQPQQDRLAFHGEGPCR